MNVPFRQGLQAVLLVWAVHKKVARHDGVAVSTAFEHQGPSETESDLKTSGMGMFSHSPAVAHTARVADQGYTRHAEILDVQHASLDGHNAIGVNLSHAG